ncbi:MAG: hypothetical protein KDD69_07160 [Bdellovibrionales bacterium]|nr:hypothetical protein [Bdellovibrionales bacterium]
MLEAIERTAPVALYRLRESENVCAVIASTPETRRITNDPFVVGVDYTNALRDACAVTLKVLRQNNVLDVAEQRACVFNILRGGLNFGLREALHQAFGWNTHASAFVSAQRARQSDSPEDWYITEHDYKKIYLPPQTDLFFGDVVATGTSLHYGLSQIVEQVRNARGSIRSITFFTIGGACSEAIVADIAEQCRSLSPDFRGALVVYFEGRFGVATPETNLRIKLTGTDLLRRECLLAPEFFDSQYQDPAYPLERCTIYDAGSRAFWLPEYLEDVREYWAACAELAEQGTIFEDLCRERMPDLDPERFGRVDLRELCERQLRKVEAILSDTSR